MGNYYSLFGPSPQQFAYNLNHFYFQRKRVKIPTHDIKYTTYYPYIDKKEHLPVHTILYKHHRRTNSF